MNYSKIRLSHLILATLLFFLNSCSSFVKNRSDINVLNIKGRGNFSLNDQIRSSSIYKDFKLEIETDLILRTPSYVDLVNQNIIDNLADKQLNEDLLLKIDQDKLYFLGIIYEPDNLFINVPDLQKEWVFYLEVGDKLIIPSDVVRLTRRNIEYLFLVSRTQLIDNWSQVFLIIFDYDYKQLPNDQLNILLKGFAGDTFFRWKKISSLMEMN